MARQRKLVPSERLENQKETMREVDNYLHTDKMRSNNPPASMAQYDTVAEPDTEYAYDPNIDPSLQWAGKAERTSFAVPRSSIHIHESVKPLKIIDSLLKKYRGTEYQNGQTTLWHQESPAERMKRRRESIEFYQHGVSWTNRMIAGDSLVIMNSLLEKESMAGQVQMIYFDPPYGIKYKSNFQPFVDKRDVKDGKDEDLSQEPEMVKAFRDTWELGIHSYLTYIRDRLLLARELLSESGSVFVQISDENVHHIREICDEIFGPENFISQIFFQKTSYQETKYLANVGDQIIWYGKNKSKTKIRKLYHKKVLQEVIHSYDLIEYDDQTTEQISKLDGNYPIDGKYFRASDLTSAGVSSTSSDGYVFNNKTYYPKKGNHWKTNPSGLDKLVEKNRLIAIGNTLCFKKYLSDFPYSPYTNIWTDTQQSTFSSENIYSVQTAAKVIQRCILMTSDPGDLVLDITCGSGTTAFVAETWGRRWITCDTSRVAITLAKQRLMTATYDYFELAHPEQGVGSGFVYKTVPHITLKSIAQNEPPAMETLYDQPVVDKTKIRVSGPFTLEALPAPIAQPLEQPEIARYQSTKQDDWQQELYATGILGRGGNKIEFSRIEPLQGTVYLQAEGETKENPPRRAVICFGSETQPLDSRQVDKALTEAEELHPKPQLIIFAAFQFDPEASKDIDEAKWPGVTILKAQMNTDLMTEDLKKKRSSNQSFWLIGQPDVELISLPDNKYQVRVNGFDYYNVKTGAVDQGTSARIAMWMLDTDYDGLVIEPEQVFFPLGGKNGGWTKLAKTLKAEINPDVIETYAGTESLPFEVKESRNIAVKIIDDRGIESLKIIKIRVDP